MGHGNGASAVKLYYRIGEVAGIVGVEPHVLRYWETEFPSIRPQKSRSGQRVYSRKDVEKLLRVKELLYAQRFTIAGARQRLRDGGVVSAAASGPQVAPCGPRELVDSSVPAEESVGLVPHAESKEGLVAVLAPQRDDDRVVHTAAQTLRTTLLGIRVDVCRLLESLDARGQSTQKVPQTPGSEAVESVPLKGEARSAELAETRPSRLSAVNHEAC